MMSSLRVTSFSYTCGGVVYGVSRRIIREAKKEILDFIFIFYFLIFFIYSTTKTQTREENHNVALSNIKPVRPVNHCPIQPGGTCSRWYLTGSIRTMRMCRVRTGKTLRDKEPPWDAVSGATAILLIGKDLRLRILLCFLFFLLFSFPLFRRWLSFVSVIPLVWQLLSLTLIPKKKQLAARHCV